ncbi:hypothetical protein C8R43DRAFT_1141169 [Mycena crocata]|nr:hypothetical protein C8R43DRAFT_1141169 [Mycena crocata]
MPPKKNSTHPKEMFKPYVADDVPDHMPFPDLSHVVFSKGDETAVPKLNEYQRNWILDVAIRNIDLPGFTRKEASLFYDKVKDKAFDAKAFKHQGQPGDADEEARLPALITAWKRKEAEKKAKKKNQNAQPNTHNDNSDDEEDEDGRGALLRGYTKLGWCTAIQKVMSNKRGAESAKLKMKMKSENSENEGPVADAPALSKLVGLTVYSGRDKFREDRHEEIYTHSKTLTGESNAGGKFRQAEAELWAKEDQASWEAAAAINEDVDWEERQQLVASGFRQMVDTLHASRKFRPFVATMLMGWLNKDDKVNFEVEAVPEPIVVEKPFKQQFGHLVDDSVNAMYAWAQKPLQNYIISLRDTQQDAASPVFGLSMEALDEMPPKELAQAVSTYLVESYAAAFGAGDIPWPAVASEPDKFYDVNQFKLKFVPTGLVNRPRREIDDWATALITFAGVGTSGFFRPAGPASRSTTTPSCTPSRLPRVSSPPPRVPSPPPRTPSPPPRTPSPPPRTPSPPPRTPSPPPRTPSPPPRTPPPPLHTPSPPPRVPSPPPRPEDMTEGETERNGPPGPPKPRPRGVKRKAEVQLGPEAEGSKPGRPSRTRKTPAEAEAERTKLLAEAANKPKAKPSWTFVPKTPLKTNKKSEKHRFLCRESRRGAAATSITICIDVPRAKKKFRNLPPEANVPLDTLAILRISRLTASKFLSRGSRRGAAATSITICIDLPRAKKKFRKFYRRRPTSRHTCNNTRPSGWSRMQPAAELPRSGSDINDYMYRRPRR